MNDKEIILKEIDNCNENIFLLNLCILLKDKKQKKKILINNEYGILGTLLYKYINNLDKEILKEICIKDILKNYIGTKKIYIK